MNEELRAITKNQRSLDSAVMMSSLIPSEKYSCSGSPLIFVKGSTAMAGRSGSGSTVDAGSWLPSGGGSASWDGSLPSSCVCTTPMKRRPLRGIVRISFWLRPLSPTAVRAALMRLVSVEFRHDSPTPDRGDKIILADDAVSILSPGRPEGRRPAARHEQGVLRATIRGVQDRSRSHQSLESFVGQGHLGRAAIARHAQ